MPKRQEEIRPLAKIEEGTVLYLFRGDRYQFAGSLWDEAVAQKVCDLINQNDWIYSTPKESGEYWITYQRVTADDVSASLSTPYVMRAFYHPKEGEWWRQGEKIDKSVIIAHQPYYKPEPAKIRSKARNE